ncbi:ribosomal protein S6 kinase beta-1-like [Eleutherodactylus coqui]|uniref:ribosomal protein S6 kinase beta-1-like n=1 Tax=Eleutherodactylus coqui TaxID=57060 RepID=UPI00346292E2
MNLVNKIAIKPENILVAEMGHIKISDIGLSIDNIHGGQTATGYVGTADYMVPEIIAREEYNAGVDWFSFGVILKEMVTDECAYHQTIDDVSSRILLNSFFRKIQPDDLESTVTSGSTSSFGVSTGSKWKCKMVHVKAWEEIHSLMQTNIRTCECSHKRSFSLAKLHPIP